MKQFSHSKLQTYERCPLQYKLQYLTKIKTESETTIEAFMGSQVHNVLELLYGDLLKSKLNSLDELLAAYDKNWQTEWNDEIVINDEKFKAEHYFETGRKCIQNYYEKYAPFDQDQTLGVEKKINLKWGEIEIIGYVDRLAREKDGVYAVHDYKTGSMMEQAYADKDRQLALYSIAIKQKFKEAKRVKLIWHYVNFGEDVISERTDQQLEELKADMLKLIGEINRAEKEDNFPARETKCEWCGFWEHCPKKKHLFKVAKLPKNKYLNDSGVKLSNKYIELVGKKSEINKEARTQAELIDEEMEKIEEAILKYAEKHDFEALQGSEARVIINKKIGYDFPTKSSDEKNYAVLEDILKDSKYWKDISTINSSKLEQLLMDDAIEVKIRKKIVALAPLKESVRFSIKKK
ncbi:MAG: PD-(D/E)XK nuclease family protein [Candidatus Moranbacteria bacterium]|nr:PD-(D/E)XK nuclease family protein [Candidatus Moranbacteria bacterium]